VSVRDLVTTLGGNALDVKQVFKLGTFTAGRQRPMKIIIEPRTSSRSMILRHQSEVAQKFSAPSSNGQKKYKAFARPDLTQMQLAKFKKGLGIIKEANVKFSNDSLWYNLKISDSAEFQVVKCELNNNRTHYNTVCSLSEIYTYFSSPPRQANEQLRRGQ
jgi:hypothetical protein